MIRRALLITSVALLFSNCSHRLEGEGKAKVDSQELTYCQADEQAFVLTGENLSPMVVDGATDEARIELPTVCMVPVQDLDGNPSSGERICIPEPDVSWVSQKELRFIVRSDLGLSAGVYDVVVTNPDGSKASGNVRITVLAEGPLVFWSDPAIAFNGISTQGTIYGSGLGEISTVALRESDTLAETEVDFQPLGMRNNRLQATVPIGTAVGTYDVVVRTAGGCAAELIRGLQVTDTVDLTVSTIDPSFGWTERPTPVTITGEEFGQVPRAYLNPDQPSSNTVASALSSIALVSPELLTAVVPQKLPAGLYDLIVVNPDGRVGLLDKAFTVTSDDPPLVSSVSPNYLDNSAAQTVTIAGSNFRDATVTASCRAADGAETSLDGTVTNGSTDTSLEVSLPVDTLTQGTVCVIRVTNSDGSYFDFSAIGISNPASNLNEFIAAPDLITARRAPAVTAGRATQSARFIYTIGGDDGAASSAMTSVETAPIDIFGVPGDWYEQPVPLPGARSLAGVVSVGKFLYLVGGNDGNGPTSSVLRAQILDPLEAPIINDVTARRSEKGVDEGVAAGVWYYRVSAVMADDDDANPGGETLASDPIGVSLPAELDGTLVLTLYWDEIAGAKGYRVYRSPTGTETIDGVRLLAEVSGGSTLSYTDSTGATQDEPPRPLGATGEWAQMPDLAEAREAAGVAVAQDPESAGDFHIFAIGGQGASSLSSVERLTVTIDAGGRQTVAKWAAAAEISSARSELSAFAVSHVEAAQVPAGVTYLYAGGGAGAGTMASDVDVAEVTAGGVLAWASTGAMKPARSGYAGLPGAGFLFAFGGAQSMSSDGIASAEIDPGDVPQLINWNNEGVRLITERYLAGSAEESAFIYVVGGTTTGGPTAKVERTVL